MIEKDRFYFRIFCVVFWVSCTVGFIAEEVLPFLESLRPFISVACDFFLLFVGLMLYREKKDIFIGLIPFLIVALLSTIFINKGSVVQFLNGFREFFGILFGYPAIKYFLNCYRAEEFKESFDRQLYAFLLVQAVCVPIGFLKYGAGDFVGGSFGNWNSGPISLSIYIIVFYFMNKNWDDSKPYLQNIKANLKYIILVYPTMMNETKISFICFFMLFVLIFRLELKSLLKVVAVIPLLLVALMALFFVYVEAVDQDDETSEMSNLSFYEEYLIGEDPEFTIELAEGYFDEEYDNVDQWTADVPRFTKILSTSTVLSETKGGLMFGAGLGQFKGGKEVETTRFAKSHRWFVSGTRPLCVFVITQIGLIGYAWFLYYMIVIIGYKKRKNSRSINVAVYLGALFLALQLYLDIYRIPQFSCIFILISLLAGEKANKYENEKALESENEG